MGIGTAATIIGDALGLSLSSSNLASAATMVAGQGSAIYTYNGDTYYLGAMDGDATFENGEVIVRFIGVLDAGAAAADIVEA